MFTVAWAWTAEHDQWLKPKEKETGRKTTKHIERGERKAGGPAMWEISVVISLCSLELDFNKLHIKGSLGGAAPNLAAERSAAGCPRGTGTC